jgi:hypothetical protein
MAIYYIYIYIHIPYFIFSQRPAHFSLVLLSAADPSSHPSYICHCLNVMDLLYPASSLFYFSIRFSISPSVSLVLSNGND